MLQSLIQRSYRDDVAPSHIERFLPLILDMEEDNIPVTPCFTSEGVNFMHIRISNLYSQYRPLPPNLSDLLARFACCAASLFGFSSPSLTSPSPIQILT